MAPDWRLNDLAAAFLQSEMLSDTPGYAQVQQRLLRESGLEDESVETILTLRAIMREWQDWKAKQGGGGGR